MIDIFLGLAGALVGLACFGFGYALAREKSAGHRQRKAPAPCREETERAEEQRRAMEEEQRAFRALTGYSADIAYGSAAFPWEENA